MATVIGKLPPDRIKEIQRDIKEREERGILEKRRDEEFVSDLCKETGTPSPFVATAISPELGANSGNGRSLTPEEIQKKEHTKFIALLLHLRKQVETRFTGLIILTFFRGSMSIKVKQYESDKVKLKSFKENDAGVMSVVESAITRGTSAEETKLREETEEKPCIT